MKIVIIGIQGSGKSTQGNKLAQKLNVPYLSTGHIFRELAREHTPLGRYIKETMTAGYLIPDERTLKIVSEYLSKPEYKKGYILDGFPRTLKQAEVFENGIKYVFYLRVSDKEAFKRLSYRNGENGKAREDDTAQATRKRIDLFHQFTEPVLAYYKKKGILYEIAGEKSIEEVHKDICRILKIN